MMTSEEAAAILRQGLSGAVGELKTARISAKLPIALFIKLKVKVAERRTSIQDVAVQMFTRYVDED